MLDAYQQFYGVVENWAAAQTFVLPVHKPGRASRSNLEAPYAIVSIGTSEMSPVTITNKGISKPTCVAEIQWADRHTFESLLAALDDLWNRLADTGVDLDGEQATIEFDYEGDATTVVMSIPVRDR